MAYCIRFEIYIPVTYVYTLPETDEDGQQYDREFKESLDPDLVLEFISETFPEPPPLKEATLGDIGGLYGALVFLRQQVIVL